MPAKQARDIRRDGTLFFIGLTGIVLVELAVPAAQFSGGMLALREFFFGGSLGLLLSGVFRATARQTLVSTLSLAVGFAVGSVITLF
ncbi:hypothetical protein ACH9L7_06275 [Haloferax sp. S1W]|uniref:hypothetical protein n=1 Tax=Haloferax sp. S1W TaxID=3377110 RepID=UPI0037CA050D